MLKMFIFMLAYIVVFSIALHNETYGYSQNFSFDPI